MVFERHRSQSTSLWLHLTILLCSGMLSRGFVPMTPMSSSVQQHHERLPSRHASALQQRRPSAASSSSALHVWWFAGGTEPSTETPTLEGDSCELVAVRIERTSPNSRRIAGEITVEAPLRDVWAILTDYDKLASHVPNLVESKTVSQTSSSSSSWETRRGGGGGAVTGGHQPGDGQYKCRLYQKGAQKIVGFDFSASVTMDMTERILEAGQEGVVPQARQIGFKCVDSFFFSEFDGTWKVQERYNDMTGSMESVVSYSVDVRPKGPVPVAALEWRIREDVPTNLRAVKHAALTVGYDGVMAERRFASPATSLRRNVSSVSPSSSDAAATAVSNTTSSTTTTTTRQPIAQPKPGIRQPFVTARLATYPGSDWGEDETMAAYLEKDSAP